MKEQLIEFETAKLAKEKGFDWFVNNWFGEHRVDGEFELRGCTYENLNKHEDAYSAPTQSLLQKWLREKHNLYINPLMDFGYTLCEKTDNILQDVEILSQENDFNTYEEALEKGLYEALKLIK